MVTHHPLDIRVELSLCRAELAHMRDELYQLKSELSLVQERLYQAEQHKGGLGD
jgi:hypothetical protein